MKETTSSFLFDDLLYRSFVFPFSDDVIREKFECLDNFFDLSDDVIMTHENK